MKNIFYIYIYLDPRRPGHYEYNDLCFLYEPMYIGKGKDRRYKKNDNRNEYFNNKINKIKSLELEPIILKLLENLNEEQSLIFEKQLIKKIGRIDLESGPLVNMTDGGEGISGYSHLEKAKNEMSKKRRGKDNPNYGKFGMMNPNYGSKRSYETKVKMSEKQKGKNNPSSKLTENDIIKIWNHLDEKLLLQREIGKLFEVSQTTISDIKRKKIWTHIKEGVNNGNNHISNSN